MMLEQIIYDLKKYGEENDIPNISLTNACFLRDLIKISDTKTILEVGMANGLSTINFAFGIQDKSGHITSIEFSPNSYNNALENFKKAGVEKCITPVLGNALDELPKLEGKFDLIFIDAMKKRTLDFFILSYPKLREGGIMIIDDVIKFKEKMLGFYAYLDEQEISYNVLPIDSDDGIIMIVK